MKKLLCLVALLFVVSGVCYGRNKGLLIDDLEGLLAGGPDGTRYFDTVELVKQ